MSFCFLGIISASLNAQDLCELALEKLYEKGSGLIAVIKINTDNSGLYSSTVEISNDCEKYIPFLSVKDPDVVKTKNGLCAVLPASELKPNLCGLRVTFCNSEKECQSLNIDLKAESGHYVAAEPAYYEMTFP
ncbi:hypothetical protein [Legionella hackeliae]|uniref:hypothetical protein n=1 Tax=Legionella hackeliae TaxID=449 RepID=UPI0005D41AE2|nr:hypothetical protein [Legionella hackeliae]